ncbi:MAG TPA: class I SAM-dependent methyltransferase [Candidatus Saccharimonadales bacterium]|nr:class I SAM-dependent methyltransferase [Candidatus Saccharimonadales bacterium]
MTSREKASSNRRVKSSAEQLFQPIACPLCDAKSVTIVRKGRFPANVSEDFLRQTYRSSSDQGLFEQVVRCRRCQLVYLSPRLKPGLIIDAYAEGEDESFISQDPMRIRTFKTALQRFSKKYRLPFTKKTKLLDIGCAGGAFLRAARSLGLSTVGIEPNRWLSEYARKKHQLDVRAGVLSDYTFNDNEFDLITLWDVIEHVPSPESELKEIHRILKLGGYLLINYPDYQSLPARLLGKKWPFWLSVHLTYYTPATIRRHLEKRGFEVLSISPHWQTLELGYVLGRITPYFGAAKYLRRGAEKIGLATLPIKYWVGQTKVVAKKC